MWGGNNKFTRFINRGVIHRSWEGAGRMQVGEKNHSLIENRLSKGSISKCMAFVVELEKGLEP